MLPGRIGASEVPRVETLLCDANDGKEGRLFFVGESPAALVEVILCVDHVKPIRVVMGWGQPVGRPSPAKRAPRNRPAGGVKSERLDRLEKD